MRKWIPAIVLTAALAVTAGAQAPAKAPSKPAPVHDLSGVWMMRNPDPIRQYSNSTFSKGDPEMTEWAKEKFKSAKASNQGDFTLEKIGRAHV